jgi:hypothetical protein
MQFVIRENNHVNGIRNIIWPSKALEVGMKVQQAYRQQEMPQTITIDSFESNVVKPKLLHCCSPL